MIYETLKNIVASNPSPQIKQLLSIIDVIQPKIKAHLKMIESQLPNYDNHDIEHCKQMIEIAESLIPDLTKLNPYELFLLYMSVLIHDTAMALPNWEYEILRLCEGQDVYKEGDLKNPFLLDGKKKLTFTNMKNIIIKNAKNILPTEDGYKDYVFALDSKEALLEDLAERAIEYNIFRNGYTDNFDSYISRKDVEGYLQYSKYLREEFIRRTHASRVEINAKAIYKFFDKETYGNTRKQLANLLALICKSHGEHGDFIWELPCEEKITADTTSNIQFIAIVLRLSDILHFSIDRASISHFVEKMIDDPISRIHWQSKFEGVTCSRVIVNESLQISMSAYCAEPKSYYFLHDYAKWIENEILLYYKFYRNLNPANEQKKYFIPVLEKVDTNGIKYDEDVFTPESDLKFTLDQKRIIELLMGVNLYKNELMCLRELYQNALDTCRYMTSVLGDDGIIEFGIEAEIIDGKESRYLYCLDNGMGMSKEIIHNHFLKVGNSYYNSEIFKRAIVEAEKPFSPVSKFGIGLLSCFMLCDRMDITTKVNNAESAIRFVIEGVHEQFYYTKPKRSDIEEKLSRHGTLIKLYLKNEAKINNETVSDAQLASFFVKDQSSDDFAINQNLFCILLSLVKICPPKISVLVNLKDIKRDIIPLHTKVTSVVGISFEKLVKIMEGRPSNYVTDELIDLASSTEWEPVKAYNDSMGLEYRGVVLYPPKQNKEKIAHPYLLEKNIVTNNRFDSHLLYDGITVSYHGRSKFWSKFSRLGYARSNMSPFSFINFYGKNRPSISVDRESIVSFDNIDYKDLEQFLIQVAEMELRAIINHFSELKLEPTDELIQQTWDIYFDTRGFLLLPLLKTIQSKIEYPIYIASLSDAFGSDWSLQNILNSKSLILLKLGLNVYNRQTELFDCIFSHVGKFELTDNQLLLKNISSDYSMCESDFDDLDELAYFMDKSVFSYFAQGNYSEYHEITQYSPIVNKNIVKCFDCSNRLKNDEDDLELGCVYPEPYRLIGQLKAKQVFPNNVICLDVYNVPLGEKDQAFSYYDQRYFRVGKESIKSHILYYFVSPSDEKYDISTLNRLRDSNPQYYEGLLKGWSVLFLGATNEVVTNPGLTSLHDIMLEIPDDFWDRYPKHQLILDGSIITKEYVETLRAAKRK